MIFKNEDFPEYYELMMIEDKKLAERMMLEIIYKDFEKIKIPEVDGIKKS